MVSVRTRVDVLDDRVPSRWGIASRAIDDAPNVGHAVTTFRDERFRRDPTRGAHRTVVGAPEFNDKRTILRAA